MEVNCEPIRIEHAKIHDPWLVHVLQPTTFWNAPEKLRAVKQGLVRRTILRTTLGVSTWQGLELVGQQRVRTNEGVVWVTGHDMAIIIMPSHETCFPVSNLLQNLLRYIGSESKSGLERKPQHSDSRLGNKLSNILWRHPGWLLWNCSRLMEMWHMFECSEWNEIGVLLFTCSGTWTLNQHQYIFLGLINRQGQLIRCSDSLMKHTPAKGAGFLLK